MGDYEILFNGAIIGNLFAGSQDEAIANTKLMYRNSPNGTCVPLKTGSTREEYEAAVKASQVPGV